MSAYELINKLEKLDYFNSLVKHGLIPVNWIDYKVIYEFYLKEVDRLKLNGKISHKDKRLAKQNTVEEFNISERSVYLIIQKMRS